MAPAATTQTEVDGWAADEQVALYRFFDESGALLYVGITNNPRSRWIEHRRKPWWPRVARRTIEWCDGRAAAERAETLAIETERPELNVLGTDLHALKCKVALDAHKERNRVERELRDGGVPREEALMMGRRAEREFKIASGLYPNGVAYPSLEQCGLPE